MRITNIMMSNTMLMNVNRNMKTLDNLWKQQTTTKKILVASDNPILASRALKFRTNVAETQQYLRNVEQGLSWMEVTEGAFNNVVEILKGIRDRCEQGANGPLEYSDKQTIMAQINQYMQNLGTEMNQTYAGRYVFSGYRTDQEAILQKDNTKSYRISQSFEFKDIEQCMTGQRSNSATLGYDRLLVNEKVNIVKLPYDNLTANPTITVGGTTLTAGNVIKKSIDPADGEDAYATPPAGTVYYIEDTGELVLSDDIASQMAGGAKLDVTYHKSGFKQGELNPLVYFKCTDTVTGKNYNMDEQAIKYEFSVNTRIQVNSLAKDVYTTGLYSDLKRLIGQIDSLEPSSLDVLMSSGLTEEEANAIIEDEKQGIHEVMYSKFNNMLNLIDKHFSVASKEQTDLGSRMNRLELIQNRLDQDEESYTKLLSDNEDADMYQVIMLLSNAQAVFDASLKAGMNVMQMSLANYI